VRCEAMCEHSEIELGEPLKDFPQWVHQSS
jgi:hypothetical protein